MKIFEVIMLICFGISWPVTVYKTLKTKSTQGKSLIFMLAIVVGYISGIVGKIVNSDLSYVLILYCFNLMVVLTDLTLYFVYKNRECTRDRRKATSVEGFIHSTTH